MVMKNKVVYINGETNSTVWPGKFVLIMTLEILSVYYRQDRISSNHISSQCYKNICVCLCGDSGHNWSDIVSDLLGV